MHNFIQILAIFGLIINPADFNISKIYSKAMQSYELIDEQYIKKLNEIIEFFKTEREGQTILLNLRKEENTNFVNIILYVVLILATISLFDKDNASILEIMDFAILVFIMFFLVRNSHNKHMIHEILRYNTIINTLQSLKTLTYKVDLSKLNDKLKYRYHLRLTFKDLEKYISETWFDEVENCLLAINNEILEKENVLDKEKLISKK